MTVASEITRIKNNITKAYNSAKVKGAIAPAVQNSDNLASCIDTIVTSGGSGGSGDGDKIFVKNLTGKEIEAGEKVLVNFTTDVGTVYGNMPVSSGQKPFINVMKDGRGIYIGGNSTKYICSERNGEIATTITGFTAYVEFRYPVIITDSHVFYKIVNVDEMVKEELDTGNGVKSKEIELADDLYFTTDTGILHNTDGSLTYDTGYGTFQNNQKAVQIFGNKVVLTDSTSATVIIDVSDFPNCTQTTINLPKTFDLNLGVTGAGDESFHVFVGSSDSSNKKTAWVYQIVNGSYIYAYSVGLPTYNGSSYAGPNNVFFNQAEKVLCVVDDTITPRVFILDKVFKETFLPAETFKYVQEHFIKNDTTYPRFATNRDMSGIFVNALQRGTKDFYGYIGKGLEIAVKDNYYLNYNPEESYTGFATGEVDENGNVEVSLTLADKVDVTVVTDVDVADNEITFEGLI